MYKEKLISAKEAAKLVKSNSWVDYGFCCTMPYDFDKALKERLDEDKSLTDINFRGGVALRRAFVTEIEDAKDRITWNSWHTSGIERKMIDEGFAYYIPLRYSEMPRYYRENIKHVDVACLMTTPMDEHGYFNFGISASHMKAICDVSDIVIVEVNNKLPRCLGGFEESIHISDVDYIIEGSNPEMSILPSGTPTDIDKKVAELILPEIMDGACLQLGIGGMPNAVGMMIAQSDLKDLSVHTEMYVDGFVDIAKAGKISGRYKKSDKYRQVFTFAAGTKKLYDYVDNNPEIMAAPVDYVNDIRVISEIDNFISINNALELDLFGQVVSESSGTRHISGAGGALDFVLGAYLSKGGKSILCCSSTVKAKDGTKKSRILPTITQGGIITAARPNIHYMATEYGIVNLKGASTWQRAEMLINIADPDFRDELIAEAEKMKIWKRSNKR